jgi:hypothetical protein
LNLNFSKILGGFQAEIAAEYQINAIQWIDKHLDRAWDKMMVRLEAAISHAMTTQDYFFLLKEGEKFRDEGIRLLRIYKKRNKMDEFENFRKSIGYLKEDTCKKKNKL